jgi:hypothetical protein
MNHMLLKTPEERKAIAAKSVATRQANIAKRVAEREAMALQADSLYQKIKAMESKLANLEALGAMQNLSDKITGKALLRHDQIVESSRPWQQSSGVYFLIDEDKIVYVGQSVNIYARIPNHHDKKFDRYSYVPCKPHLLNILESLYIHCLQPKLNFTFNGVLIAPLTLSKLLEEAAPLEKNT